jgi:membrane protein required for beta-lactamase induction
MDLMLLLAFDALLHPRSQRSGTWRLLIRAEASGAPLSHQSAVDVLREAFVALCGWGGLEDTNTHQSLFCISN